MSPNDEPVEPAAHETKPTVRERMAATRSSVSRPAWVAIGALTLLCAGLGVGLVSATADDRDGDRDQFMGGHGPPAALEGGAPGMPPPGAEGSSPGMPPTGTEGGVPPMPPPGAEGTAPAPPLPPLGTQGNPPATPPQSGEQPRAQGNGNKAPDSQQQE